MRKKILIIAAFILFGSIVVFSQSDSTRYINGLPVSEDDTAEVKQMDVTPINRQMPVAERNLPAELREVLDEEEIYRGWQDTTIYYEKNTGLYIVPIRYTNGIKIFGLTKDGEPVTFSEVSDADDQ